MAGLRLDQVNAYRKDMYKFERTGAKEKPTMYDKVYAVKTGKDVTGAGTKFTQKLSAGPLTRHTTEGQTINFKSPLEGWTTYGAYATYSDGLTFTPEAIEDTIKLGDMLNDQSKTWGVEVRVAKEQLAARAFVHGGDLLGDSISFDGSYTGETDPSGALLYDSKPLFTLTGNKRTTKGGGQYYNSVASAYGTPILGQHFETIYNLATATNNKDEQDRVVGNDVDTVLSKVGADLLQLKRILLSQKMAGGQLNDVNVYEGLIKNIWGWDYLTESAIYVGKAKHEDFQFHERLAPNLRFFRDEDTAGYKASIRTRFGLFFRPGSWRAWHRGGGTSA